MEKDVDQSLINFRIYIFMGISLICHLLTFLSYYNASNDLVILHSQIADLIELEKLRGNLRDLGIIKDLNEILGG